MHKSELQKAQDIIDALYYDDKMLTQWQHELLEEVILTAQAKVHQPNVMERSKRLTDFLIYLNQKKLLYNHSFDYEQEAVKYCKKLI